MTNLIFMPDDQTLVSIQSNKPACEILQEVKMGLWRPPEPYAGLYEPGVTVMKAILQGRRVVVIVSSPMIPNGNLPASLESVRLSPRQAQVLQGLLKGLTTKEMAYQMGLKPRTIKMHIAALKTRLGASTRAQSVGMAAKLGLLNQSEQDPQDEGIAKCNKTDTHRQ